jgi:hypothetical protein
VSPTTFLHGAGAPSWTSTSAVSSEPREGQCALTVGAPRSVLLRRQSSPPLRAHVGSALGLVGDEPPHRREHPRPLLLERQHGGAVSARTITSRLSAARALRYMARAAPTNGWSSAAATNSTGTRRRGIAVQALTARRRPARTGSPPRPPAGGSGSPPRPWASTSPVRPRPSTTPTSIAPAEVGNRNGLADLTSSKQGTLPGGASGSPNRQSSLVHHVAQDAQPAVLGDQQVESRNSQDPSSVSIEI